MSGVKLLAHELWFTDEEARAQGPKGHSNASAVAEFARAANVERLLLVHHPPKRTSDEIREMCETVEKLAGLPSPVPREGAIF